MQNILFTISLLPLLISIGSAGVGHLSPEDEAQALNLFFRICHGGSQSGGYGYGTGNGYEEGADLGGTQVFCKSAREDWHEKVTHQVQIPQSGEQRAQILFVQPPSVRYQHQVVLSGVRRKPQQTKVYVLPQKASHQIAASYQPGQGEEPVKPVVFFLKGGRQGGQYGQIPTNPLDQSQVQYGPPLGHPQIQPQPHPLFPSPGQVAVPVEQQYLPQPQPEYGVASPFQPSQPQAEYGVPLPSPSQPQLEVGGGYPYASGSGYQIQTGHGPSEK